MVINILRYFWTCYGSVFYFSREQYKVFILTGVSLILETKSDNFLIKLIDSTFYGVIWNQIMQNKELNFYTQFYFEYFRLYHLFYKLWEWKATIITAASINERDSRIYKIWFNLTLCEYLIHAYVSSTEPHVLLSIRIIISFLNEGD